MHNPEILEEQIRECYARAAWTHKTHEKQSDQYQSKYVILVWSKIILSALAAIGCLATVKTKDAWAVCSGALSVLLLLVNLIFENRNYAKLAEEHKTAAAQLWNIRESYLSLLTDLKSPDVSLDDIRRRRDEILVAWSSVNSSLPRTGKEAYIEATKALHAEELTFSEGEVDHILPEKLRRGKA